MTVPRWGYSHISGLFTVLNVHYTEAVTVCVIKISHDLNEYNSTNIPDIREIPFD